MTFMTLSAVREETIKIHDWFFLFLCFLCGTGKEKGKEQVGGTVGSTVRNAWSHENLSSSFSQEK